MIPLPARSPQDLVIALGIEPGWTIAAIGGGGKMELLGVIAKGWAALGGYALLSSTTRAADPRPTTEFETLVVGGEAGSDDWVKRIRASGGPGTVRFVARESVRPGLLEGIAPEELEAVRVALGADLALVKADGTRGQGLSAHGPGEPRIPARCDLVMGVVGIDVWGQPVSEETVHRAELFCEEWGYAIGEPIDDGALARPLLDPGGYRRFVPMGSRYVAFLDRSQGEGSADLAERIARILEKAGVSVAWFAPDGRVRTA